MLVVFGDESGTPHPASKERFFTVALLVARNPRRMETLVRRTRRSLRRRAQTSELKAARSHPRVIRRFLTKLAAIECEIYVTVVDKRGITPRHAKRYIARRWRESFAIVSNATLG